jgi:hypothetical protein
MAGREASREAGTAAGTEAGIEEGREAGREARREAGREQVPEVAGLVVPLDAVVVLAVEDSQARLVVELLQPLDGDA